MIFITASNKKENFSINKNYCDAVAQLGQKPILISKCPINYIDKIIYMASGIILSGGGDIHPKFFSWCPNTCFSKNIDVQRDEFEILLCQRAIEKNLPVLGICRGIQILNVALGGNLILHIPNHCQPKKIPNDLPVHIVYPQKNSFLYEISDGKPLKVNSIHHQAINRVAENLTVSGISNDGIIEAVEMKNKKFVMGVQWHPECLNKVYTVHNNIFQMFVKSSLSQ